MRQIHSAGGGDIPARRPTNLRDENLFRALRISVQKPRATRFVEKRPMVVVNSKVPAGDHMAGGWGGGTGGSGSAGVGSTVANWTGNVPRPSAKFRASALPATRPE